MIELNPFLQPIGSPITSRNFTTGYEFDSNNERGAVTGIFVKDASITNAKIGTAAIGTANIGTLTFNEISGGTATLGGTANGDGVAKVLNESGGTSVILDKDGVRVYNGAVTIENSTGDNSVDSLGIVSINNFAESVATAGGGGTQNLTANGTLTDIAGGSLTFASTRSRAVLINYYVQGNIYNGAGTASTADYVGRAEFEVEIDGTAISGGIQSVGGYHYADKTSFYAGALNTASSHYFTVLGSGTHTLKLRGSINYLGGTPAFNIFGYRLSYMLLGT